MVLGVWSVKVAVQVVVLARCVVAWPSRSDRRCGTSSSSSGACGVSEESLPRVAYLVLAHNDATLSAASRLVEVLYDAENWYLIHVDAKHNVSSPPSLWSKPNVEWGQVFDVRWAKWSMIEPTLWAMVKLLGKEWEVFVNLSGDSWPVLTPRALRRFFARTKPHNLVTSSPSCPTGLRPTARSEFGDGWHKKQAYPSPMVEGTDLEAHYGSQWMALRREFVEFVVRELETQGTPAATLRDWFVGGTVFVEGVGRVKPHIPDETFFPTLLAYHNFSLPEPILFSHDAGPTRAFFYIRMDEHYPWSSSRQRLVSNELDKKERPWGPYYLGVYDLAEIRASGAAFVRKVSLSVDPNLYHLLPVDSHDHIPNLDWPPHANLLLSQANPQFHTISRGHDKGCVRVAESVHCPPTHVLRPDVALAQARLQELLSVSTD